jgi:hypothetical protein
VSRRVAWFGLFVPPRAIAGLSSIARLLLGPQAARIVAGRSELPGFKDEFESEKAVRTG